MTSKPLAPSSILPLGLRQPRGLLPLAAQAPQKMTFRSQGPPVARTQGRRKLISQGALRPPWAPKGQWGAAVRNTTSPPDAGGLEGAFPSPNTLESGSDSLQLAAWPWANNSPGCASVPTPARWGS